MIAQHMTATDWKKADHMPVTKEEASAAIDEAGQRAYEAGVEPDVWPVQVFLLNGDHPFGNSWAFCFCVSCDIGHRQAQAEGYENMYHRAAVRSLEKRIDRQ